MTTETTWFVIHYETKADNDGHVLWQTESPSKEAAEALAVGLRLAHPDSDFEVSDLPELMAVYEREKPLITAVLESTESTKH